MGKKSNKKSGITGKNIEKKKLTKAIEKHPEFIMDYVKYMEEHAKADPYDLDRDEKLIYKLEQLNKLLLYIEPPKLPMVYSAKEFFLFITALCNYFKSSVENRGLYEFFWLDKTEFRKETQVHKLFDAIVRAFCDAYDVDISPETITMWLKDIRRIDPDF